MSSVDSHRLLNGHDVHRDAVPIKGSDSECRAMCFPPHATAWIAVDNMLLTSRLSSAGGLNKRTKKS